MFEGRIFGSGVDGDGCVVTGRRLRCLDVPCDGCCEVRASLRGATGGLIGRGRSRGLRRRWPPFARYGIRAANSSTGTTTADRPRGERSSPVRATDIVRRLGGRPEQPKRLRADRAHRRVEVQRPSHDRVPATTRIRHAAHLWPTTSGPTNAADPDTKRTDAPAAPIPAAAPTHRPTPHGPHPQPPSRRPPRNPRPPPTRHL